MITKAVCRINRNDYVSLVPRLLPDFQCYTGEPGIYLHVIYVHVNAQQSNFFRMRQLSLLEASV